VTVRRRLSWWETGRGGRGAHAGPRSTPAVGNGKVCTLGVGGVVSCLDAYSGKVVWRIATGSSPTYSTSSSPMIVDGSCIVFVKSLTAYDLASGAVKWEWPGGAAPYGSPVLMTVDGTRQIVTPGVGQRLVGVNLANGKLLWEAKVSGRDYGTPIIDGNMVFFSAGQSSVAFKIEKNGDEFQAKELWKKGGTVTHEYYTPLLKNGLLYSVSHSLRPCFFCLDAKTGRKLWTDDTPRGHCGSILNAGPVLIALTSDQYLVVFQASDKGYMEVAKYQVCDSETWSVPIIAGKRVFVKEKVGSLILWTIE
jgi:outer membrane protein assembly factor BamB